MKAVNRSDIAALLSYRTKEDLAVSSGYVQTILSTIAQGLAQNRRTEIRNFGSFELKTREARMGRNPKTGEQIFIAPKAVPHFRAGLRLKQKVDK